MKIRQKVSGRVWAWLTVVFLLTVAMPCEGFAAEAFVVEIQGIGVPGETLTAVVSGEGIDEGAVTYQWYYGPGKDLTDKRIHALPGAERKTWTVSLEDCIAVSETAGKFSDYPVWVKASADGQEAVAKAFIAPGRNDGPVYGAVKETDGADVFTVDGRRFILLDSAPKTESGAVFVLARDDYGSYQFDTAGNSNRYSTERETNIGYWLNHGFLTACNGEKGLPDGVKDYLREHLWITNNLVAAEGNGIEITEDRAKVALLSMEEFNRYISKFGIVDEMPLRWWLRSSSNGTQALCADIIKAKNEAVFGFTTRYDMRTALAVRPAFYLNHEIFANVKLDVYSTGEHVKALIRELYPDCEALSAAGYDEAELKELGYEIKVAAYSVAGRVIGMEQLGSLTLTGGAGSVQPQFNGETFVFAEPVEAGAYRLTAETKDGYYISSAKLLGEPLTVGGGVITLPVTGDISDLVITVSRYYDQLDSVAITGIRAIGETLIARWEPADIPEEALSFQWYYGVSMTDAQGRIKAIPEATGKTYTPDLKTLTPLFGVYNDWPIILRATLKSSGVYQDARTSVAPARNYEPVAEAAAQTPEEYTFIVTEGESRKSFVLLDAAETGFYVIAKDSYGAKPFDSADGVSKMDNSRDTNISAWLNGEFLQNGSGGQTLPAAIRSHLKETTWKTIRLVSGVEEYETSGRVSLLSLEEYNRYAARIGVRDAGGNWWLRSATSATQPLYIKNGEALGITDRGTLSSAAQVRPVFYLDKEFFRQEKVQMGAGVMRELGKVYTYEELSGLYSDYELLDLFGISRDYEITDIRRDGGMVMVQYTNRTKLSGSPLILIQTENADGSLGQIYHGYAPAAPGTDGTITVSVPQGLKLQIMVWDNLYDMRPLTAAVK